MRRHPRRDYSRRGRRYKAARKRRIVDRAKIVGIAQSARENQCTPQSIYRWADELGVSLGGP